MSDLPKPMTDPDCDLRGMPCMLLDVHRLRDSDLAQVPDPEAFRCAVLSWCASWDQVPAASLPNDDRKLAYLLGYGRDVRAFAKARAAGGLRGWELCDDGRLYHPVVAEKAREARAARVKQIERTEAARRARHAAQREFDYAGGTQGVRAPAGKPEQAARSEQEANTASPPPDAGRADTEMPAASAAQVIDFPQRARSVTEPVTAAKGSEVKRKKESSLRDAPAAGAADARSILFSHTLQLLRHMTGQHIDRCRGILGRLLRDLDDDASVVIRIVQDAADERPIDPLAWIMAVAGARRPRAATAAQLDRDWNLPSFASAEALAAVEAVGL